jgi:hypothetical protein
LPVARGKAAWTTPPPVADSIAADEQGDLPAVACAWDRWATNSSLAVEQADRALTEGFAFVKWPAAQWDSSYLNLASSAWRRRRTRQPFCWIKLSSGRESDSLIPGIFFRRAAARARRSRLQEAFEDFGVALDLARQWRLEVVAADAKRVSSEAGLEQIYSSYIDAGNSLYFVSQRYAVARATFQAAEENRAASLQALLTGPGDWRKGFTPEYWEELAQLRASEVSLLHEDSRAVREHMIKQRARRRVGSRGERPPSAAEREFVGQDPTALALISRPELNMGDGAHCGP